MGAPVDNPSPATLRMREWRAKNHDHAAAYQSGYKRQKRQEVYDHYGSKCVCCGESRFEFLSVDHTEGGGTRHRRESGLRGAAIIGWLIKEGFPEGFRVLCHNCNQATGFYGFCPHQREE